MVDISEIGEIVYEWDFDEDEYMEWLQESEMEDSEEARIEYINHNVTFELDLLDNETFHHMEYESMSLDEIESNFGERIARQILQDCMEDGEGRLETQLMTDEVDINNPQEVNNAALKLFSHGDYTKNARGFILTNGIFIHTPSEHNMCTKIDGVKNTFHFISMGNIRMLDHSIDIGKEPTREQYRALLNAISYYEGDTIYLDLYSESGNALGLKIDNVNPSVLVNQIKRFYNEGIPPTTNMYENKVILRLTESELRGVIEESVKQILKKGAAI